MLPKMSFLRRLAQRLASKKSVSMEVLVKVLSSMVMMLLGTTTDDNELQLEKAWLPIAVTV